MGRTQSTRTSVPGPTSAVPVVFIGGIGRSGSTLVEQLVGAATGYVTVGELVHLWKRGLQDDELCTCRERFRACPFWTAVGERAFGGWDAFDLDDVMRLQHRVDRTRHVPRLLLSRSGSSFDRSRDRYAALLETLYRTVLAVSGAPGVIDTSKHASTGHLLAGMPQIDLKVLHVVRDSPAVAYSWTRRVSRPQVPERVDLMATYSPMRSAAQWTVQNTLVEALAPRGVAVHRVRYEDMVSDPRSEMRALLRFLGVDEAAADSVLDGTVGAPTTHHAVSGNPARLAAGPLRLRRDEEWRVALSPSSRRLVLSLTAPVRWRYGYGALQLREHR